MCAVVWRTSGQSLSLDVDEGVAEFEVTEAGEVAIAAEEFGDAVFEAEGSEMGAENDVAAGTRLRQDFRQKFGVARGFCEQEQTGRSQRRLQPLPCSLSRQGDLQDRRWVTTRRYS